MIGYQLGGRYEIIERIGGGGMALVYKAHDILLNRNVAIKVLRQQFVHDEEFIRRFRREAQSAASLSHPNVVSIYDVGQEDDIHYIVMECVEGQNLNEIIKERAPLQVEEAVRIASQICDALDHAHQNQIIHRDIKPHNILIGRNGRVKVTDFGIARAVTSTTITQTGSVVGSVHYFSPEHAKGVATGEKSDLYSLGIVLYQMLTARLPFLGESPISVALKHLQEQFEEPRAVNPLIPQSVENIILKSMRKNPNERYQSAKEMLLDLDTCLLPDRLHEPKITFSDHDDTDQTRVVPAIKPQMPRVSEASTAADSSEKMDTGHKDAQPKRGKPWVKPTIWVGVTLLFLGIMLGVVWYVKTELVVPDVEVPNVVNVQEDQARKMLTEAGIEVDDKVIRQYKEGFAPGVVFDQSKPAGTKVKKGSIIQLSVSMEKPLTKMPDLKGMTYEEATKALYLLDIKENQITQTSEYSETEAGKVISQTPGVNEEFDPASVQIKLTISKGQESVNMPNLVGMSKEEAEAKIKELGLVLADDGIKEEPSFTQEAGKVVKQWPYEPNTAVTPGSEVTLFISSGYPPEALNYTFNLPVAPAQEGTPSKIRIVYTDARGENQEWGTRTISTTEIFSIDLVLAPNKDAVVSVYRDGQFYDTYPISYRDAKEETVVIPTVEPQTDTPPDDNGTPPTGLGDYNANSNHDTAIIPGNDNPKDKKHSKGGFVKARSDSKH
ncbi:Stk1 family PASTA domain-containing Ser/Thr kinase [Paenibacillus sediminis]|uniref:non-specific serine/threonine protein kinase n=1 Tax=Paenibacillus sediminis TaxID=664909 RepID=A0ABS4GZA0_9BACL|nr:Stk1 family PASTA domain-containing Ser/Thr kinase [Paenibacillus sediminis]MBP1935576.1 serine/threonine-protein kinase [Paenibacillus sediminis]